MESHAEFIPLLIIAILAFIVPMVATRLQKVRVPIVVGEIIAGIIFGKSGLDLIHSTPIVSFLAEFGFAFLMFLSGLEMDFEELARIRSKYQSAPLLKRPIQLSSLSFILTLVLSLGFGWSFTYYGLSSNTFIMGLVLCTTSLGIVVPILKEFKVTDTSYGQVMLVNALIGDFVTLFLLSAAVAILSKGPSFEVFFLLIVFVIFGIMLKLINYLRKTKALMRVIKKLSTTTSQIRVRGVFALLLIWVVLAQKLGLEIILGAFLAGIIISLLDTSGETILRKKLDGIGYSFFIPIFFITVGVDFDIKALLGSESALLLLPVLIITAYIVKVIPALIYHRVFSWRNSIAAGFLLSTRLSLIIAASEIALSIGIFSTATYSALVLVALFTCTASPIMFALIYRPTSDNL